MGYNLIHLVDFDTIDFIPFSLQIHDPVNVFVEGFPCSENSTEKQRAEYIFIKNI